MPNFIASGTVNVTAGQTLVTFEDVLLTEARDGDTLELYGANKGRYTLASIGADLVSAQFSVPFDGVTQTDAPYTVRYDSLQRVPPLELADQLRRMRDQIRIFERTAPLYQVQSLGANAPPGAPVTGDMYVVGTMPTGAWAGQAGNLAQWTGTVWQFTTAEPGWMVYSAANGKVYFRGTSAWIAYVGPSSFIEPLMDDGDDVAACATLGALRKGGDTMGGRLIAAGEGQGDSGLANVAINLGEVEIRGNGTGAAALLVHRPGAFAAYLGLDTDNQWKVGGGSHGANAYKLYHAASIVGAVSQSGGAPTGAIVERGSNANGNYVRFADGTQICWRRDIRAPGNLAAGTFASAGAYTFPIAFAAPPILTNSYDGGWAPYIVTAVQGVTSSGIGAVYFTNLSSAARDTTGSSPTFHYIAVGRWF